MKLKDGRVTILFGEYGMKIEVHDNDAGIRFLDISLTPEQTVSAFSRLSHTPCDVEVRNLNIVGKKQEHKEFVFEVSKESYHDKQEATRIAQDVCPEGWEPDLYFDSQGSFFVVDSKQYARTIIRRWV